MVSRKQSGFTLIELMIVVAILGVLAALAVPVLTTYVYRSKSSEATLELKQMFSHAASYYIRTRASAGMTGGTLVSCTVASGNNAITPSAIKQAGSYATGPLAELGFATAPTYYRLELENNGGARCNVAPGTADIYTFRARGDLDADGSLSLFELAAGSSADNELYHARSFYSRADAE